LPNRCVIRHLRDQWLPRRGAHRAGGHPGARAARDGEAGTSAPRSNAWRVRLRGGMPL